MYNILVVFQLIPETCKFYVLKVSNEQKNKLETFHNQYVNSGYCSQHLQDEINDFFYSKDGEFKYKDNEVNHQIHSTTFDLIIITGFIL